MLAYRYKPIIMYREKSSSKVKSFITLAGLCEQLKASTGLPKAPVLYFSFSWLLLTSPHLLSPCPSKQQYATPYGVGVEGGRIISYLGLSSTAAQSILSPSVSQTLSQASTKQRATTYAYRVMADYPYTITPLSETPFHALKWKIDVVGRQDDRKS